MADKTINEVCKDTRLSRFTLSHAAKGGLLKKAAHQSGKYWLIDDEHEDFKKWLQEHDEQPRVVGIRNKKQISETGEKTP
jgi:predicted site-specific integrase-resolvase